MTKTKLKMETFKINYELVLKIFTNVSLLLKFWASGFCWCTLYKADSDKTSSSDRTDSYNV